jgi:hypothetical protein
VDQLHRVVHVSVTVNGSAIGQLAIRDPGPREYRLGVPALPYGNPVSITLASDFVWHARDIFPESLDERDLSIAVSSIGFAVRP